MTSFSSLWSCSNFKIAFSFSFSCSCRSPTLFSSFLESSVLVLALATMSPVVDVVISLASCCISDFSSTSSSKVTSFFTKVSSPRNGSEVSEVTTPTATTFLLFLNKRTMPGHHLISYQHHNLVCKSSHQSL